MSILELKIKNDRDETVVYTNEYIPVAKYREFLEMNARHEDKEKNISEVQKLDDQMAFVASLFDGVTSDMLYNGLEMKEFNDLSGKIMTKLIGGDLDPKESD